MGTIKVDTPEAAKLVRDSLELEKNILKLSLGDYEAKLKKFESKNRLSSEKFYKRFAAGELGDDREWFDWLFAYKARNYLREKLDLVEGIRV